MPKKTPKEPPCPPKYGQIPVTLMPAKRNEEVVKLAQVLLSSGPGPSNDSLIAPLLP